MRGRERGRETPRDDPDDGDDDEGERVLMGRGPLEAGARLQVHTCLSGSLVHVVPFFLFFSCLSLEILSSQQLLSLY